MSISAITVYELKRRYQRAEPEGYFFDRKTMAFFGDTMKNYGVKMVLVNDLDTGESFKCYALYRKAKTPKGAGSHTTYFSKDGYILCNVEETE